MYVFWIWLAYKFEQFISMDAFEEWRTVINSKTFHSAPNLFALIRILNLNCFGQNTRSESGQIHICTESFVLKIRCNWPLVGSSRSESVHKYLAGFELFFWWFVYVDKTQHENYYTRFITHNKCQCISICIYSVQPCVYL